MNVKAAAGYVSVIGGAIGAIWAGWAAYFAVLDDRYAKASEVQDVQIELAAVGQAVLRDQIWQLQDRIAVTTDEGQRRLLEERLRQILAEYCAKYPDPQLCGGQA